MNSGQALGPEGSFNSSCRKALTGKRLMGHCDAVVQALKPIVCIPGISPQRTDWISV